MGDVNLGDLISETFNYYTKNFMMFFKNLTMLYVVPMTILQVLMMLVFVSLMPQLEAISDNPELIFSVGIPGVLAFLVAIVVSIVTNLVMTIATIKIVIKNDKNIGWKELWQDSKKYIMPMLGLTLLMMLAIMGLTLLLIIPALIFGVFWAFATTILVYEDKKAFESMKASKRLVEGNWWRVLGYTFLFALILMGISFGLGFFIGIFGFLIALIPIVGPIIQNILGNLLTIIIAPLSLIFMVRFYEKLKESKTQKV